MREQKVWMHYIGDIIAADLRSAVMLATFLRRSSGDYGHVRAFEVIDIQRRRLFHDPYKIHSALRHRKQDPFDFILCRN